LPVEGITTQLAQGVNNKIRSSKIALLQRRPGIRIGFDHVLDALQHATDGAHYKIVVVDEYDLVHIH
jgi:hypothetical protein